MYLPQFAMRRQDDDISHLLNQVHCCDAMALLRRLPDASIDMVLTSPPYDNLRTYNGFTFPFEAIAKESYRVLKDGGVLVWVVGDATINGSETLTSFRQALYFVDECGFKMHDTMIYARQPAFPNFNRYQSYFEYMFVLIKGSHVVFNPILKDNKSADYKTEDYYITETQKDGTRKRKKAYATKKKGIESNIWHIDTGFMRATTDTDAFQHPAIFPEKLAHDHIYSWSNEGDIVLDFFMGSGTTAKMARKLNRQYIGCDISLEYVELARKRLQDTDPFQATELPDGSKQLSLFEGKGA